MNDSDIVKKESPNPDEVLVAIQSFNDAAVIINIFRELGWNYSFEIKETLMMAKQNANLSIKFKALKHLRELLREAAETSGLIANVSRTVPNSGGGHTTMSGKRIAGMLSPVKKIESTVIKESQNDQIEEIKPNRGSSGQPDENDTAEVFPQEDHGANPPGSSRPPDSSGLGSPKPADGGTPPKQRQSNDNYSDKDNDGKDSGSPAGGNAITENPDSSSKESHQGRDVADKTNPCVKTRPPTCVRDLFPGISTSAED